MISWRNPDARHADWGLDTYVQAVLDALDAVERITGADQHRARRRLLRRHHRQPRRRPPGRHRPAGPAGRVHPAGHRAGQRAGRRPAALIDRDRRRGREGALAAPRLPGRPGARRGVRLAPPRRPDLELLGQQLPARQEATGVRHPVLERRHHPDDRATARRLRRHRHGQPARHPRRDHRARRADRPVPGHTSTPTSSPASPTTSPRGRTATAAPSCSAARPGSCCPPAATSRPWSTRPATRRRPTRSTRTTRRTRRNGSPARETRAGQLVARLRRLARPSAAARAGRTRPSSAAAACAARRGPRHLRLRQAEEHMDSAIKYDDIGRSLGTDYFRIADQLTARGTRLSGAAPGISSTTRCCR